MVFIVENKKTGEITHRARGRAIVGREMSGEKITALRAELHASASFRANGAESPKSCAYSGRLSKGRKSPRSMKHRGARVDGVPIK